MVKKAGLNSFLTHKSFSDCQKGEKKNENKERKTEVKENGSKNQIKKNGTEEGSFL